MSALLSARRLTKRYPPRRRGAAVAEAAEGEDSLPALDAVDLELDKGETLALVGESGSGKTTLGRCLLRLVEPTSGEITFDGGDLLALSPAELRRTRRRLQMVFQDPQGALDPRMRIGAALAEPIIAHDLARGREVSAAVSRLLARVGLLSEAASCYPHEFSGGQRQRIAIARALATDPELLVADEPVSALDVSIRAQIVNLLSQIQVSTGLALLFIAHDLALVEHVADRVAVMYRGRIVEAASRERLFGRPAHPYTVELLASIPSGEPGRRRQGTFRMHDGGLTLGGGCAFRLRCPAAVARCAELRPELEAVAPGHRVACHFPGTISPEGHAPVEARNFSDRPA